MKMNEICRDSAIQQRVGELDKRKTPFETRKIFQICLVIKSVLDEESYKDFVVSLGYESEEELIADVQTEKEYLNSNEYISDLKNFYKDPFFGFTTSQKSFIQGEIRRINESKIPTNYQV